MYERKTILSPWMKPSPSGNYHPLAFDPIYHNVKHPTVFQDVIRQNMIKLITSVAKESNLYNLEHVNKLSKNYFIKYQKELKVNDNLSSLFSLPILVVYLFNIYLTKQTNFINFIQSYKGRTSLLAGAGIYLILDFFPKNLFRTKKTKVIIETLALQESLLQNSLKKLKYDI